MKLIACLLFLTSLSAFGNNPNTTDQSDAFNSALFGKEKINSRQQTIKEKTAPSWTTPAIPEKQEMQEAPVERVNKWQEQSRKAQEGERP